MYTFDEASNGVNIRGGTTDRNLLLLDEAPLFNPTHRSGLFSAFPTDALSSVNVQKGNVPSRFERRGAFDDWRLPIISDNLKDIQARFTDLSARFYWAVRKNVYSIFFRTGNEQLKPYILSIFAAYILTVNYNFKFE